MFNNQEKDFIHISKNMIHCKFNRYSIDHTIQYTQLYQWQYQRTFKHFYSKCSEKRHNFSHQMLTATYNTKQRFPSCDQDEIFLLMESLPSNKATPNVTSTES